MDINSSTPKQQTFWHFVIHASLMLTFIFACITGHRMYTGSAYSVIEAKTDNGAIIEKGSLLYPYAYVKSDTLNQDGKYTVTKITLTLTDFEHYDVGDSISVQTAEAVVHSNYNHRLLLFLTVVCGATWFASVLWAGMEYNMGPMSSLVIGITGLIAWILMAITRNQVNSEHLHAIPYLYFHLSIFATWAILYSLSGVQQAIHGRFTNLNMWYFVFVPSMLHKDSKPSGDKSIKWSWFVKYRVVDDRFTRYDDAVVAALRGDAQ